MAENGKLWTVTVSVDVVIYSDKRPTWPECRRYAYHEFGDNQLARVLGRATPVQCLEDLPADWYGVIPRGNPPDERTCREIVREQAVSSLRDPCEECERDDGACDTCPHYKPARTILRKEEKG